ncbi:LysR family transcriptional regulator [Peribacillus butanolivorans]|uniref:LysR substrate-binding domain-containing protein n=1 Tax=Peribacillus butanolivorans TaxID=421767 RepID=UPI00207D5E7F|nr:LysR family transcriptional regulator [Peribacillus butanolivorans]MCO0599978.1 LysR family transcriptional regulator [Peribacillus butanolivorans]
MDPLGIEAFLAVVRQGSLTGAANSLFLSQSTLSNRLAQLEEKIGMNLIERGRGIRTLSLTPHGQDFLLIAKRWEEMVRETKQIRNRKTRLTLSIGAVDSIQGYFLPPVYQELFKSSQDIDIRIRTQQSSELYILLERGEIDVAFSHLEQPMPNMIIKKVFSEPLVVISKDSSLSTNDVLEDQNLDTSHQIYLEWNTSFRAWHDRWLGERDAPTTRLDTSQLLFKIMDGPKKWAIIPLSTARVFESAGQFSIYKLTDPPPDRICYQIYPRHPRAGAIESLKRLEACLSSVLPPGQTNALREDCLEGG